MNGKPSAWYTDASMRPAIRWSPRNTPYSFSLRPASCARARKAMLCAFDPVKYSHAAPKLAGATARRSARPTRASCASITEWIGLSAGRLTSGQAAPGAARAESRPADPGRADVHEPELAQRLPQQADGRPDEEAQAHVDLALQHLAAHRGHVHVMEVHPNLRVRRREGLGDAGQQAGRHHRRGRDVQARAFRRLAHRR
jgi:hypothetical protein